MNLPRYLNYIYFFNLKFSKKKDFAKQTKKVRRLPIGNHYFIRIIILYYISYRRNMRTRIQEK